MSNYILSPIYIPSKDRPAGQTFELLREIVDLTIVVEPQDEEVYRNAHPSRKILVLPENNKGIAYVRNYVMECARQNGVQQFWQIDDDVCYLYENIDGKTVRLYGESITRGLAEAEKIIKSVSDVAQGSLEYKQFGWGKKPDYVLNSRCDVIVFIDTNLCTGIRYRPDVALKEDRDFTMQLVAGGRTTMRITKYSFHSPKNGSNSGGLKPLYDKKIFEIAACEWMERTWGPDVCKVIVKPNQNRTDIKINWRKLKCRATARVPPL